MTGHTVFLDVRDDIRSFGVGDQTYPLEKEIPGRFDQRHTIRTIMNSRTYQLSAIPNATNRDDETNFSHTIVRSLPVGFSR